MNSLQKLAIPYIAIEILLGIALSFFAYSMGSTLGWYWGLPGVVGATIAFGLGIMIVKEAFFTK